MENLVLGAPRTHVRLGLVRPECGTIFMPNLERRACSHVPTMVYLDSDHIDHDDCVYRPSPPMPTHTLPATPSQTCDFQSFGLVPMYSTPGRPSRSPTSLGHHLHLSPPVREQQPADLWEFRSSTNDSKDSPAPRCQSPKHISKYPEKQRLCMSPPIHQGMSSRARIALVDSFESPTIESPMHGTNHWSSTVRIL